MPPALDAYLLTRHRDSDTIERFLDDYIDRAVSKDYTGEEFSVVPLTFNYESAEAWEWEWVSASTLTDIIRYGLSKPPRAFYIYLTPKDPKIVYVILAFTTDGQLIFGLSIDDEGEQPENLITSKNLLHTMAQRYNGHMGLIIVETGPPLSESEFVSSAKHPLTAYFADFSVSGRT